MQVCLVNKMQPHDVVVGSGVVEIAVGAQFQHAPQTKAPFGADQVEQQRMWLLCLDGGPGRPLLWDHEMDELLVVPKELSLRLRVAEHLAQLFEQFEAPGDVFSGWKPLAQEVPLLSEHLPRRKIVWIDGGFFGELRESDDRIIQK